MNLELHAMATRDMSPHYQTLVDHARGLSTIVEFGVRSGVSTWALLDGLDHKGRLISMDVVDVRNSVPDRIKHDKRWEFVCGDDRTTGIPTLRADLVFIDTSHEYHHTLAELDIAARLEPTEIILHDYALPDVEDAVHRYVRHSPYYVAWIEPSQWGLVGLRR